MHSKPELRAAAFAQEKSVGDEQIPRLNEKGTELVYHSGGSPDGSKRIDGCPFVLRCQFGEEKMRYFCDRLEAVAPSHFSACLRIQLGDIELTPAPLREGFPNELV